jgi:hypothetical protein
MYVKKVGFRCAAFLIAKAKRIGSTSFCQTGDQNHYVGHSSIANAGGLQIDTHRRAFIFYSLCTEREL